MITVAILCFIIAAGLVCAALTIAGDPRIEELKAMEARGCSKEEICDAAMRMDV